MHLKRSSCNILHILLQGIVVGMKLLDDVTLIVTSDLNLKIKLHNNYSDLRSSSSPGLKKKSMHCIIDLYHKNVYTRISKFCFL